VRHAQAVPGEQPDEREPGDDRPKGDRMIDPALALGLREAEGDARQPWAQQRCADPVEGAGVGAARVRVEHPGGDDDRHDRDGHVHDEDPRPGRAIDDEAADDGPEDRPEQDRYADQRERPSHALRPGALGDQRESGQDEHAAAEALQDSEGDQRAGRRRQRAQRRAAGEQRDRCDPGPLGAEALIQPESRITDASDSR
jgi:hypothetical protein